MKNLFGVNCTGNPAETKVDGNEFLTMNIGEEHSAHLAEKAREMEKLEKSRTLSTPLKIIMWACCITVIVLLTAIVTAANKGTGFVDGFHNAPILYILIPILFAIWLTLWIIARKKQKGYNNSEAKKSIDRQFEEIKSESQGLLGVPKDAADIDIMSYCYEIKDGVEVVTHKKMYDYVLLPFYAFTSNENLVLCSLEERYEIPIKSIKSIERIGERVSADSWNRDISIEDFSKDKTNFKIVAERGGSISFAPYYRVTVSAKEGKMLLLLPGWEYENVSALTGLSLSKPQVSDYTDD